MGATRLVCRKIRLRKNLDVEWLTLKNFRRRKTLRRKRFRAKRIPTSGGGILL
jgi:hypothetical protein